MWRGGKSYTRAASLKSEDKIMTYAGKHIDSAVVLGYRRIMHHEVLRSFHRKLHRWYDSQGRKDLPWRVTSDSYAVYLSEIMLQQTQVKTVLERYYFQFLKRFPTLSALASAKQDEVLQAWQGLGYYTRALNLHKAAQRCGGILPETVDGLMALPGIGRNTAHAVAAFAFHQPVAVMEANVRRVLSRVFALSKAGEDELWDRAAQLLDKGNPFDYNQAMMDIGATVCTRRAPRCSECPLADICAGKVAPELYPAAKPKKIVNVRRKHIVVFKNSKGQFYAQPRQSRFLNGLYHFAETDAGDPHLIWQGLRYAFSKGKRLGAIRQQYSHFTLEADIWLMAAEHSGRHWHKPGALVHLPVSMAEKKVMVLLGLTKAGTDTARAKMAKTDRKQ